MWGKVFVLYVAVIIAIARCSPHSKELELLIKSGELNGRMSDNIIEDARMDAPELIQKYGYPMEIHTVTTSDGYILNMHRIPHGRDENNNPNVKRPIVFLMHGLFSSSADWVLMGPGTAFGYILAEAGYDVWMGNARGNYYSRQHIRLRPDAIFNTDFWDFSWDEIGNIDCPAMIDYILELTGNDRLHYIGHSQGTTTFFVMTSLRPDYNEKIISMHALAPSAYFANTQNLLLRAISQFSDPLDGLARLIGLGEFFPNNLIMTWAGQALCMDEVVFQPICTNIMFLLGGWNEAQHNACIRRHGDPSQSPHADEINQLLQTGPASLRTSNNIFIDAILDVPQLVRRYRYPLEVHHVRTADGYILGMHRIPHGRNRTTGTSVDRPVVFLMHGLLSSSADWVLMGPGSSFAYILAEEGYDVWMGNARGNYYSRAHALLNPDTVSLFWNFSWDEIGNIDLPTMIDYVLKQTGKESLHYIGHSQGTTAFFVLGSLRPEYNEKIISMHALAPVAYLAHSGSHFLRAISELSTPLYTLARMIGLGEFLPNNELLTWAGQALCREEVRSQQICSNMLFLMGGWSEEQHNATMLPVILGHTPAGASVKQFAHYGQSLSEGEFSRFDYGSLGNRLIYGISKPPRYDLSKVTSPVFLHYSPADALAHVQDVDRLFAELGRPVGKFRIPDDHFGHLDFIWGIDANTFVYNRVINLLRAMDEHGSSGK